MENEEKYSDQKNRIINIKNKKKFEQWNYQEQIRINNKKHKLMMKENNKRRQKFQQKQKNEQELKSKRAESILQQRKMSQKQNYQRFLRAGSCQKQFSSNKKKFITPAKKQIQKQEKINELSLIDDFRQDMDETFEKIEKALKESEQKSKMKQEQKEHQQNQEQQNEFEIQKDVFQQQEHILQQKDSSYNESFEQNFEYQKENNNDLQQKEQGLNRELNALDSKLEKLMKDFYKNQKKVKNLNTAQKNKSQKKSKQFSIKKVYPKSQFLTTSERRIPIKEVKSAMPKNPFQSNQQLLYNHYSQNTNKNIFNYPQNYIQPFVATQIQNRPIFNQTNVLSQHQNVIQSPPQQYMQETNNQQKFYNFQNYIQKENVDQNILSKVQNIYQNQQNQIHNNKQVNDEQKQSQVKEKQKNREKLPQISRISQINETQSYSCLADNSQFKNKLLNSFNNEKSYLKLKFQRDEIKKNKQQQKPQNIGEMKIKQSENTKFKYNPEKLNELFDFND